MTRENTDIVTYSYHLGKQVLERRTLAERKAEGQFLTLPVVAQYMALRLGKLPEETRLLDPGTGSSVLACAVIERAAKEGWPRELHVVAYEMDSEMCKAANEALNRAAEFAKTRGIEVEVDVHEKDFILSYASQAKPTLFSTAQQLSCYDAVIANPPYFKLRQDDPRARATADLLNGRTNIYTLFMALGVELLVEQGQACFIVPRSFCSGAYFAKFRRDLINRTAPVHIHLFDSRDDVFSKDSVLQENLIFAFRKKDEVDEEPETIAISATDGISELENEPQTRQVAFGRFLRTVNSVPYFRLPVSDLDEQIIEAIDNWNGSLEKQGLQISTGPVVPFRARSLLRDVNAVNENEAVPLYWLHNVMPHKAVWPAANGKKPQGISRSKEAKPLLVPSGNYVLIRRFSAKEEPRRLTVAPFLESDYEYEYVGLENHLNYIHRPGGKLNEDETRGLSALLGSSLLDRYFRIANGNTQVNATELRALPLPPLDIIEEIGRKVQKKADSDDLEGIDKTVYDTLWEYGYLPKLIPALLLKLG